MGAAHVIERGLLMPDTDDTTRNAELLAYYRSELRDLRRTVEHLETQRANLESVVAAFVIYTRERQGRFALLQAMDDADFLQAHGLGA